MAAADIPVLVRVLALSVRAARRAGSIIREVQAKGNLEVVDKGVNDLQTIADRRSEGCIIGSLSALFPKLNIIGEEGLGGSPDDVVTELDEEALKAKCPVQWSSLREEDITVFVDPLDGTREFTDNMLESVSVLIGMSVKDQAVAGVLHQPFAPSDKEGRTIWALVGFGVSGIKQRSPPDPEKSRIMLLTRSHLTPSTTKLAELLQPTERKHLGGAGIKALWVAEGLGDIYVYNEPKIKFWDICAMDAVFQCVGGKATNLFGEPFRYSLGGQTEESCVLWGGLLVTPSESFHKWCLDRIPPELTSHLKRYEPAK